MHSFYFALTKSESFVLEDYLSRRDVSFTIRRGEKIIIQSKISLCSCERKARDV